MSSHSLLVAVQRAQSIASAHERATVELARVEGALVHLRLSGVFDARLFRSSVTLTPTRVV